MADRTLGGDSSKAEDLTKWLDFFGEMFLSWLKSKYMQCFFKELWVYIYTYIYIIYVLCTANLTAISDSCGYYSFLCMLLFIYCPLVFAHIIRSTWWCVRIPRMKYILWVACSIPIESMYGIFTYIYHKFRPNVSKYPIHWAFGIGKTFTFLERCFWNTIICRYLYFSRFHSTIIVCQYSLLRMAQIYLYIYIHLLSITLHTYI